MPQSFDKEAVAPLLRAPAEQAWRVDESIIERLRNALKMHDEDRTTIQSLASSVGDFLREAALAQNAQGEAVAEIGQCWDLRYLGADSIASIAKRHNLKVGDKLYTRAERARVPDGWRITPERNPLGGKSAMRLHAPDGRSALFGTFSEEVLARDFLNLLAAAPSQPEDAVRFPFGSWSLDGHWTPNPALKLSEREQRKHNEQHGYPMQPPEDAA
jgi:hypothetical protein